MIEIERKFRVSSDEYKKQAYKRLKITQGYLSRDPERSVRIRIKGEKGFLTIKGKSNKEGTSRFEWEKEIPLKEVQELLSRCLPEIIEKTRYFVKIDDFVFEVDEFFGKNEGLVVAEVELPDENTVFTKPKWLGKEVTGEAKYYNSSLSKRPYSTWTKD